MNKRRLLKLADFLSVLPRQKFDFTKIAVENGKPTPKQVARHIRRFVARGGAA